MFSILLSTVESIIKIHDTEDFTINKILEWLGLIIKLMNI